MLRNALVALFMASPAGAATKDDAETMMMIEAAARWGLANCPNIVIHPGMLLISGIVQNSAPKEEREKRLADFTSGLEQRYSSDAEACIPVAKLLAGPSKQE